MKNKATAGIVTMLVAATLTSTGCSLIPHAPPESPTGSPELDGLCSQFAPSHPPNQVLQGVVDLTTGKTQSVAGPAPSELKNSLLTLVRIDRAPSDFRADTDTFNHALDDLANGADAKVVTAGYEAHGTAFMAHLSTPCAPSWDQNPAARKTS